MAVKHIVLGLILLSTAWSGECQLKGLLGSVSNVVNGVVGNKVANAAVTVDAALSVVANVGFNLGWWYGGKIKVYNLAVANAQIYSQGCTEEIYLKIVKVKDEAYAAGYGPAFVVAITDVKVVGPGLYHCYKRDYVVEYYEPTKAWAIANGYVFVAVGGRRSLR